ncbi:hypothetical protein VTI74DRAFT_2184 [Chaetomium olivicolor]
MEEKGPDPSLTRAPAGLEAQVCSHRRRRFRIVGLLTSLIALGWVTNFHWHLTGDESHAPWKVPTHLSDDPMNPWENISPSEELQWQPCYRFINPSFLCARLTVPMDYTNALTPLRVSPKVHIALLLLPAQHITTAATSKPPLLLNPGGPGGSGTLLAQLVAPALQQILGADQPILGFDPRGVGFTMPRADCWAKPAPASCRARRGGDGGSMSRGRSRTEAGCEEDVAAGVVHRMAWENADAALGGLNESGVLGMRLADAGQRAVNRLCRAKDAAVAEGGSGLAHATTEHVARDMVAVVEKWEGWLQREGRPPVAEELRGKLVYWGFSYGTYLGATFARMFPDRVGRLLLDGVVDAELYETPVWSESLVDADMVLRLFWAKCYLAKKKCDFYREGDSVESVMGRYEEVMKSLETRPVTFTHPEHFFPVVLRASFVKLLVFGVLYQPIQGFPALATVLNWIYEGQYEMLAAMFQDAEMMCSISGNPAVMEAMTDAQRAIMCGDKQQPVNMSIPEISAAYEDLARTSRFADIWMKVMLKCNGWDISSPHPSSLPKLDWDNKTQIETANPILFLSNTYDPVTPLRAAVKMALKFKEAGLLEQMSLGHCTISTVSICTAKVVREYLASGKVPPPPKYDSNEWGLAKVPVWKKCGVDEAPWGVSDGGQVGTLETELSAEDRELVGAWQHVQTSMRQMQRWGIGKEGGLDMGL